MSHLFDFGISQEDPLTEFHVLAIQPDDHILCIASGGEMPLSLLCLQPGIKITAVDISPAQLALCRLKLATALAIPSPVNGAFLGFSGCPAHERRRLYAEHIRPLLSPEDRIYWDKHHHAIENGVIHSGRFEGYIKTIRKILTYIIGKKNILALIDCDDPVKQQVLYGREISGRKSLEYLFRLAFHPALYKKRGIQQKGLQHAQANMGQRFLAKFRNFCTVTPANRNYFLQYMLNGACISENALPEYCHPHFQSILREHQDKVTFIHSSLQDILKANPPGTFTKIHLSNIGDWMGDTEFIEVARIMRDALAPGNIACYRYLQKNHIEGDSQISNWFDVQSVTADNSDRFPFYTILSLRP